MTKDLIKYNIMKLGAADPLRAGPKAEDRFQVALTNLTKDEAGEVYTLLDRLQTGREARGKQVRLHDDLGGAETAELLGG